MNRRKMLGAAGAAVLTGGLVKEAKAQGRRKIGHVVGKGNNYEWASDPLWYRAQMLALTVMLFNGTSKPGAVGKAKGYFIDFKNNSTQGGLPSGHPMADVKKEIYETTWKYCNSLGWQAANDKLWGAASTMFDFANAGLALVTAQLRKQVKPFDAYTNPDECPCMYQADYDCPPVDPLL
jgi:hypothetical protein